MKNIFFVLISLLGMAANAVSGDIRGTITVSKALTKQRIASSPYQARGIFVAAGGYKAKEEEFRRMVIYLEGTDLTAGLPIQVELSQENRQFTEEVVIVPVGSTVAFPNADPIFHNVFSLSKAKQ